MMRGLQVTLAFAVATGVFGIQSRLRAEGDEQVLDDFADTRSWHISYDASSYYKGKGEQQTLRRGPGREPGTGTLEATVRFGDASRHESAFVSRSFEPVDVSGFDVLTFWYKLSCKDIDVRAGVSLRLRDAVLPFAQWVVVGGNDVVPNEWQQARIDLRDRSARSKFDPSKLARMSFIINDDDYTNAAVTLTVAPIVLRTDPALRAKYEPKPLVYTPKVRPRSSDDRLDALVIRFGGESHYNIAKALHTLPMAKTVRVEYYRGAGHRITHRESALGDLSRYDLIVLAGVPAAAMDRAEQECLCDYVASGGGLIVAGGKRQGYACGKYNASLLKLLLPVEVSDAESDLDQTVRKVEPAVPHPVGRD